MALSKQHQLNISPTATDPREKKNVTGHIEEQLLKIQYKNYHGKEIEKSNSSLCISFTQSQTISHQAFASVT